MSANNQQKRKADLKVVILGAASVGKTTLIHRYIDGKFQEVISTIGASFSLKQWGPYNIALWDTAGEERFAGLSSFYCRGAGAAILAFDVTNYETFQQLSERFLSLLQSADSNCLCVVVGTKVDLLSKTPRRVSQQDGLLLAKKINSSRPQELPYFETSSLNGQNVSRLFEYIFDTLLPLKEGEQRYHRRTNPGVVNLEDDAKQGEAEGQPAKSKCC